MSMMKAGGNRRSKQIQKAYLSLKQQVIYEQKIEKIR